MRASTRFSDGIHILCFLKVYEEARITSDLLSSSIGISPVMVRRLMGNLRQAGLVQTTQGTAQPRLARDLQKITLYDVYLAVEDSDGPHPLFNVNHDTNPQCKVGGHIQPILAEVYQEAQAAAMIRFNNVTVADIVDQINLKLHQEKLQG